MKKTALITGATHGIGLELARQFAQDEYDLVTVSRHAKDLESMKAEFELEYDIDVYPFALDLSKHGAAMKLHSELKRKKIRIDALVNNAGFGLFGNFLETALDKEANMIHLNIIALTELTKIFLSEMVQKKSGKILNVASTAAFMPGPFSAVYFASKAYVLSFSEALANELKGSGVSVSILCPGATRTGFEQRSNGERTSLFDGEKQITTPAYVARVAYEGFKMNKRIIIPGFINKLQIFLIRLAPRRLVAWVAQRAIRK